MQADELHHERLRLAERAGAALAEALDVSSALHRLGEVLVPALADWFAVDLLEGDEIRNAIVMHPDPRKVELARELQRRFPSDLHATSGAPNVIRSGVSELTETITDDMLEALIDDADLLATMRTLALRCAMVVPLQARGRTIGAITMIGSESHERYGREDLMLAEQIAARAALAIDTAQLFAQEQQARREAVEEARRTEILKEATAAFGRASTVEDVVQAMLLDGIRAAGARAGTVGIAEGDDVALVGVDGYERDDDQYWHRFGLQEPLPMADAIRHGTPIVLSTTAERNARYPVLAGRGEQADHTLVCVPMLLGSRVIGAFSSSHSARRICRCSARSASNVLKPSNVPAREPAPNERSADSTPSPQPHRPLLRASRWAPPSTLPCDLATSTSLRPSAWCYGVIRGYSSTPPLMATSHDGSGKLFARPPIRLRTTARSRLTRSRGQPWSFA